MMVGIMYQDPRVFGVVNGHPFAGKKLLIDTPKQKALHIHSKLNRTTCHPITCRTVAKGVYGRFKRSAAHR